MVTSNKAPFKEEQFNWSLIFLALYVTRYHAFMNFPHFEKLASSFLGKKLKIFKKKVIANQLFHYFHRSLLKASWKRFNDNHKFIQLWIFSVRIALASSGLFYT